MRTKVLLGLAVALMLIVSVATIGSNMGFKISIPLSAGVTKFVSLPYYNSYTDAASLYNDITAAGGLNITLYNYNGTDWERYSGGGFGDTNFAISSGSGYQVSISNSVNWIVVGSHNPSLAVNIPAGFAKFLSVPYHTTATDAQTLYDQLTTAGATSLTLYNFNGTDWERFSGGGFGDVNFTLVPGVAYQAASAATVNWTPAHF
jgi:hypothetical protein